MAKSFVSRVEIQRLALWERMERRRALFSFDLEVTARCTHDCRHCYINLPAADQAARARELSVDEIAAIADQAITLGALWCLITGGEPLLRDDFVDLYLLLKRKGLLVSVFTNACLVTSEHVSLFTRYPPRDVEVTVYGVTAETYERVTRRPGSYAAFRRGLDLLLDAGVKVRLKAMALGSNVHELPEIARFCRQHTADHFRFDPQLHLRYDGSAARNAEIQAERLSPGQIVAVEQADAPRAAAVQKDCQHLLEPRLPHVVSDHVFRCGAGVSSFAVTYDGRFRLCLDLCHQDCTYDLRRGSLREAWFGLVPQVRDLRSQNPDFLSKCRDCPVINLCLWCPARAHLETGAIDGWSPYFCEAAHARAAAVRERAGLILEPAESGK